MYYLCFNEQPKTRYYMEDMVRSLWATKEIKNIKILDIIRDDDIEYWSSFPEEGGVLLEVYFNKTLGKTNEEYMDMLVNFRSTNNLTSNSYKVMRKNDPLK